MAYRKIDHANHGHGVFMAVLFLIFKYYCLSNLQEAPDPDS
jgi:hypothetical protein